MATLETLDFLFKSSGKKDILNDINDIEKRWSDITKNVVENIQKIVELRKELSNVNDLTKETVSLVEKELEAKRSVLQEEKNISKARGDINKRIKLALQEEKTAKQREMAEKAREKANRSEGGSGGSGGGTFWGNLGGLSSFLSLGMDFVKAGATAVKTITGWAMEKGQIGVAVKRISEGKNEEETQTVLSDLVRSGWARGLQEGTVISAVSQLRQQFDEAFRLGKAGDFFDRFALGGANFKREDFLGFLKSILGSKNAQQTTALRGALSPELAEAFLNYSKTGGENFYKNIESSIKVLGEVKTSIETFKTAISSSLSPALSILSNKIQSYAQEFINWLETPEGEKFIEEIKEVSYKIGEILDFLVSNLKTETVEERQEKLKLREKQIEKTIDTVKFVVKQQMESNKPGAQTTRDLSKLIFEKPEEPSLASMFVVHSRAFLNAFRKDPNAEWWKPWTYPSIEAVDKEVRNQIIIINRDGSSKTYDNVGNGSIIENTNY